MEKQTHIFSPFGGTRFLLTALTMLVNILLLAFGFIDKETYQFMALSLTGAYITGNTTQNILLQDRKVSTAEEPPQ